MKYLFLFYFLASYTTDVFTQDLFHNSDSLLHPTLSEIGKPPIDSSVFDKWPSVRNPAISNDGNYTLYTIHNQPVGSNTLVIQAIQRNWKIEIPGVASGVITQDSRMVIFIKPKDTLCILTLGGSSAEYILNVSSFKLSTKGTDEWLAYQLNTPRNELILHNLITHNDKSFTNVDNYIFSDSGMVLLLQRGIIKDNTTVQSLNWINLGDSNMFTIWQGVKAGNFVFDKSNTQLAFTMEDSINNKPENSFWYYKAGTDKAVLLADNQSAGIDSCLRLESISFFSKDGNKLFFSLKEKEGPKLNPDMVKVDIWSYTDTKLQSQQLKELAPKNYSAVVYIDGRRIFRLKQKNEFGGDINGYDVGTDDYIIINHMRGDVGGGEMNWNTAAPIISYLVSTKDGKRKPIGQKYNWGMLQQMLLSPEGSFVIYYDARQMNYFSYEISSGIIRNITKSIPTIWTTSYSNEDVIHSAYPIAGWLEGDAAVLLYDQFDIWQIDLAGHRPPVNITNGYGHSHNIEFRLAMNHSNKTIRHNDKLILRAFSRTTKNNGFYSKRMDQKGDPELLTMGAYIYYVDIFHGYPPKKARNAEIYLIRRESASESPNYFYTKDFKAFAPLSVLHPEKAYNWLTSQLMTWKALDGSLLQGVLYKPENFDPGKKYPVIFEYYEKMSEELNLYQRPYASTDRINMPWFVSNGYLVFTPDIHYIIGEPGRSAYNSVVSAAKHLSKLTWVDATKMGIQGHSFGGFETNYIVTHTNLFAAAMSASGMSDLISDYGDLWQRSGDSKKGWAELDQGRIGATLWQRPDLYIKNSPIFCADKVTTPLLMMNNKGDRGVAFAQGVEFFTALRRLGKIVWMLQYDNGGHSVFDKEALDYTIRMTQFFNHYLKGIPAPKWMVQGIPARLKGIISGL